MKNFWSDFKKFISRGNIVDMAVGVIIGSAFSAIVTSLTNKIIMPLINLLLSLGGTNGLEKAYTFLKKVYDNDGQVDLTKSIYIDWGAFITAVINFILIALVLFIIIKVMMKSREMIHSVKIKRLTKEQKQILKERGVNIKDKEAVKTAIEQLNEEQKIKEEEEAKKNKVVTDVELLTEIKDLLKAQVEQKQITNKK